MASLLASPPTWTGSAPTWLLLVIAVGATWRVTKGGGGAAVEELSKANEILEKALNREREDGIDRQRRISALEAKTDVVLAVTPLMADHEKRAEERHKGVVEVLEAIRDSIASSTNGKEHHDA